MKLFHTENGKEVVYVQMQDIMYLTAEMNNMPIPASIITKVFTGLIIVDDTNRFNFVRFDKEAEVKFFKKLGFIIDYDQYKEMTDEQLEEERQKLVDRENEIAARWNGMSDEEREQNMNLLEEHNNLEYMMKFLYEIYAIKHHKRSMPFPEFEKKTECEKPKRPPFFMRKKM